MNIACIINIKSSMRNGIKIPYNLSVCNEVQNFQVQTQSTINYKLVNNSLSKCVPLVGMLKVSGKSTLNLSLTQQ